MLTTILHATTRGQTDFMDRSRNENTGMIAQVHRDPEMRCPPGIHPAIRNTFPLGVAGSLATSGIWQLHFYIAQAISLLGNGETTPMSNGKRALSIDARRRGGNENRGCCSSRPLAGDGARRVGEGRRFRDNERSAKPPRRPSSAFGAFSPKGRREEELGLLAPSPPWGRREGEGKESGGLSALLLQIPYDGIAL
jgi:hypothetical protein